MTDLFSPKPAKVKIKTGDIHAAMQKRWAAPEYAIMWEVGEGTGAQSGRYADAVIMSLWPSRGLELHGVEIKVSRSDWKREAADPSKAEAIAKYCHRWYVHTAPGVVQDTSEVPPMWGLREWDGKRWNTIREAERREPVPITYPFLAALLRRADGAMAAMVQQATFEARRISESAIEEERQSIHAQIEAGINRRMARLEAGQKELELFNEAFGDAAGQAMWRGRDPAAWGRAARALVDMNNGYGKMADRLRKAADELDAFAALTADPAKE